MKATWIGATLLAATLMAGCATTETRPPAPISAEQFATYKIADVSVDTTDGELIWDSISTRYAASQGVRSSSNTSGSAPGDTPSDEDIAQDQRYQDFLKSDATKAEIAKEVEAVLKPRFEQAFSPAFTGEKAANLEIDVDSFVVRNTAAVALGGKEGAQVQLRITDAEDGRLLAESPMIAVATKPAGGLYTGGGIAGIALSLAINAAINVATDAASNSSIKVAEGAANQARTAWLQLEPHKFAK